jgi:hypothetical protein
VSETENPFLTVWVELNRHEVLAAAVGGCQRRVTSMEVARPQFYGADERNNFWQIDIQGAIAEFAVAKAFDKYWEPATDKSLKSLPGDVGFYQIRSTAHKTGQLIVHERDADDVPFILAIVAEPHVKLAGYLYGGEAKEIGEKRKYGCTWVTQDKLRSVTELINFSDVDGVSIKKSKRIQSQ